MKHDLTLYGLLVIYHYKSMTM